MSESSNTVRLILDGKEVEAHSGELIIATAERHGTYIPRFCYHPRMRSVGVCRMCLVEVKGPRGFALQPACFLSVSDGLEVVTTSEKVKKAQDGVIEYLLANHPLDCPVCDKGGECPLQDQTLGYGSGETRFVEEKRHFAKPIALSGLVLLDRERCIQCDRCTRFADDVAGEALISFAGRGSELEISTFPDAPFASYFSGNTVQICPVGALTASPYRFKARPWDLEQSESTCTVCAVGCQIVVQSSQNQITRYLGVDSESVNHSWLCDKGRFSYEATNSSQRFTSPLIRKGESLVEVGWLEALDRIARAVNSAKNSSGPEAVAVLGGSHFSNEDIYAWVKLIKGVIGTDSFDCQLSDGLSGELVLSLNRATIAEATSAKVLVVISADIREELPVLFLRLREAVRSGKTKIVEISSAPTALTPLASKFISYSPGNLSEVLKGTLSELFSGVDGGEIAEDGEGIVLLGGNGNLAEDYGATSLALSEFLSRHGNVKVLPGLRRSNVNGAIALGAIPGVLPGGVSLHRPEAELLAAWKDQPSARGREAWETLRACVAGDVEVLVLLGCDPLNDFADTTLVEAALKKVPFIFSVEGFESTSSDYVDVILPVALPGECGGTTTNIEGRVTRLGQRLVPPGLAQPPWVIATELAEQLGASLGFEDLDEVWAEIEKVSATHRGLTLRFLDSNREGVVVPLQRGVLPPLSRRRQLDPIATPGIDSINYQAPVPPTGRPEDLDDSNQVLEGVGRSYETPTPTYLAKAEVAEEEREGLSLVVRRPLYGQGVHLSYSGNLGGLGRAPSVKISPLLARTLGMVPGDDVRITRGDMASEVLCLTVEEGFPEGTALVELTHASGISRVIDSSYSMTMVKLERV